MTNKKLKIVGDLRVSSSALLSALFILFTVSNVEAARTYDTIAECQANIGPNGYSRTAQFQNPCNSAYWQWSSESSITRGCAQKADGTYSIEVMTTDTRINTVWTTQGAQVCTAIAYEMSYKTTNSSFVGGNVASIETIRTPKPRNATPAELAAYGVPKLWEASEICNIVTYRSGTKTTTCATYTHASLLSQPGNAAYWLQIYWFN